MKVLIVPHHGYDASKEGAAMLSHWFSVKGIDFILAPAYAEGDVIEEFDISNVDLAVSLGGDGTLLRAARIIGYSEIPIVGISYGHLGFLTSGNSEDTIEIVESALNGKLHVSRRATLDIELEAVGDKGRVGASHFFALNEFVLTRGVSGRMIDIDLSINDVTIDSLRGDGMIVATATGSTGYALSAGGPIVTPEFTGMVCSPIAPHTLHSRSVLASRSDVVQIDCSLERVQDRSIFIDGVPCKFDGVPYRIIVQRGKGDVLLLNREGEDFYESVADVFYSGGLSGNQPTARS